MICNKYSKLKFLCASHRFNLVVNYLNARTDIRNTVRVLFMKVSFIENWLKYTI